MNKECFEKMIEELVKEADVYATEIVIDSVTGHGGYSGGQTHFTVDIEDIECHDLFVTFKNTDISFDTGKKAFYYILIPYERIIAVGSAA